MEDTADYEWKKTSYTTGSRNADADYLLRSDANAVVTYRQSVYATETVYAFDLNELDDPYFELDVFGNYLIQVSTDDKNYTTVYDYRQVSAVYTDNMKDSSATLSIFPDTVGVTSGKFYVRLANTDPSKEYGGAIKKLYINEKQLVTAQEE